MGSLQAFCVLYVMRDYSNWLKIMHSLEPFFTYNHVLIWCIDVLNKCLFGIFWRFMAYWLRCWTMQIQWPGSVCGGRMRDLSTFVLTCQCACLKDPMATSSNQSPNKVPFRPVHKGPFTLSMQHTEHERVAKFSLSPQGSCQWPSLAIIQHSRLVSHWADGLCHRTVFLDSDWVIQPVKNTFDQ